MYDGCYGTVAVSRGLVAVGRVVLYADRFVTVALCHLCRPCGTMAVGRSL